MPFYQFTVPTGGATLRHKAEVAAAITTAHSEVTGAPAKYTHCSFVEVPPGSIFRADKPVNGTRMVGIIREGRSADVRAKLLHALADAWSETTEEAKESLVIFLEEIPGANTLEDGAIGPEITEDPGAIY
ncbi:MAG TPA: tautomerase family protein [Amycolatopsis sp.]|jgi:phenylpyruvate tautomerase PptA (4-oxalocrotonate tautomerase family)|nr:tautomerase family protein [Amycolatopsis sp.]